MAANIDRFKNDLNRLVKRGHQLEYAMVKDVWKEEEFRKHIIGQIGKDKWEKFLKELPNFNLAYESWYSESLALLRQLLPDRVTNFISFYEKPKGRKSIEFGSYVIQDYLQGLRVTRAGSVVVDDSAAIPQYRQQLAILIAAEQRFESSLFEIRQLVQADLFDSEIESARELLKHNFLRAAGAIAGVVLEKHLRQVCDDRSIKISKKNPGIADLNDLLKSNSAIDIPQWRHISMLSDIRNICDHNKQVDPAVEQVKDLIDGTDKVLRTIS